MDVAEQIVVVNEGRVEQAGSPEDIYDRPASEFVMGFAGPVTRLGDRLLRPHDLQIARERRAETHEATITRLARLGFEVRLELELENGSPLAVQLSPAELAALAPAEGERVHVRTG